LLIKKLALAGTLESSDALIRIQPADTLEIHLESTVIESFGEEIRACVKDELRRLGISGAIVTVQDRGALDCVLRARVETAALRGAGEEA
jgi:citrate lyase subunit gamma (acyl carrier protein)